MKRILIDAMGGDKAPLEILRGAAIAAEEYKDKAKILLVGNRGTVENIASENQISLAGIELFHAEEVIGMEDPPTDVRTKKDSSLRRGCELLAAGEADAFVSAGSTGALHMGATLFVRRIPGVLRAAIATILPLANPILLMDSGANTVVTPAHLFQFALMGSAYMKGVFGVQQPRVGLLNIGQEKSKGTAVQVEAYRLLSEDSSIRFVGNVEARDVPFGCCDVLVTDGFTGNVLLKSIEGMASFFSKEIKGVFMTNVMTKAGYPIYHKALRAMKKKFDSSEYGGAPLLGFHAPVIKAHGSSGATALKNAVRQALQFSSSGILGELTSTFALSRSEATAGGNGGE